MQAGRAESWHLMEQRVLKTMYACAPTSMLRACLCMNKAASTVHPTHTNLVSAAGDEPMVTSAQEVQICGVCSQSNRHCSKNCPLASGTFRRSTRLTFVRKSFLLRLT